jgi:hypothetical protein
MNDDQNRGRSGTSTAPESIAEQPARGAGKYEGQHESAEDAPPRVPAGPSAPSSVQAAAEPDKREPPSDPGAGTSSLTAKLGFGFWPLGRIEYTVTRELTSQAKQAREDRRNYIESLEHAERDQVFRYVLLLNSSALEQYVLQARIQAQQSFQLSKFAAAAGFVLIAAGIGLGVYFNVSGTKSLSSAYLSAGAGALTEFVSGVLLYLYSKTLQQVNRFHDRLVASQQISLAFLASDLVGDGTKRDDSKQKLAEALMNKVDTGVTGAPGMEAAEALRAITS